MRVFAFLNGLFEGIRPEIFIAAGIVLLAVDCLIAFRAERETVFAALALFTGGLCFLPALISSRFSDADTMVYGLLLLVIGSFFYLLLLAFLKIKETRRARREKRARESRQAMFTLPDKENSFVRDRLNTSLHVEEEVPDGTQREYDMDESKLRLNHVRDMLAKLKAAPLAPGDRLESEEISRLITLYATKNRLTAKEIRDLNDCLSAILNDLGDGGHGEKLGCQTDELSRGNRGLQGSAGDQRTRADRDRFCGNIRSYARAERKYGFLAKDYRVAERRDRGRGIGFSRIGD